MRTWPSTRRVASKRLALVFVAAGLVGMAAVPAATRAAGCTEVSPAPLPASAWVDDVDAADRAAPSGIDLEVRLFNLRIEFPWMKALPIRPGHHIVITMLPSDGDAIDNPGAHSSW